MSTSCTASAWTYLVAGSLLASCAIAPPESIFTADAAKSLDSDTNAKLTRFEVALKASFGDPPDDSKARTLFKAGSVLVDLRCKDYFRRLGIEAQNFRFGRKEFGLTSGVVAAIQGLTGASAKAVAVTGAAFGFGGSSLDNYGDAYMFSPDISGVEALVNNSKSAFQTRAGTFKTMTYDDAISLIGDYETICEVQTIRRLVNESLASAKPVASFAGSDDALAEALNLVDRTAIAQALGVPAITDKELLYLYWFLSSPTDEDLKKIDKGLTAVKKNITAEGALTRQTLDAIRRAFQGAISRRGTELETKLAALKKSLEALPPKKQNGTGTPESTAAGSGVASSPPDMSVNKITVRVPN